jgi:gamma-tubulin complex component 5
VRGVERWCAEREEDLFHSQRGHGKQLVVSLLSFESSLRQRMADVLEVVDAVLRKLTHKAAAVPVMPNNGSSPIHANNLAFYHPSILSTLILDGLFAAIREQLSMGETATSQGLLSIFTHTAQPIWSSIGRWLRDGMDAVEGDGIHGSLMQDEELFIEKGDVPLGSPDFWDEGYRLRMVAVDADHSTPAQQRDAVPEVFRVIAPHVLAAGKEVGLLRAMGLDTPASFRMQEHQWLSFKQLYTRSEENASKEVELAVLALAGESRILDATAGMRWASDALVATVQDYAVSVCQEAHSQLIRVLKENCELSRHLAGMQALFFMRRGDIMSEWCDNVFTKVCLEVDMLLICLTSPRSTPRSGGTTFTSLTARFKTS